MSGRESYLVDRIDRSREVPANKAARTARAMYLRMLARRTVISALADLSDPEEKSAFLGDLIDVAAEKRHPILGRVETATALNSLAAEVCAVFRLGRAIKNAGAEQAYARLTAANDGARDEPA